MSDLNREIAETLCERVDWDRPELEGAACAEAYRAGDAAAAAFGFVRYLREREIPDLGYSAEYVARLRERATPAFREQARRTIADLMATPSLGGSWADGRETLLRARPEELQVGACEEDFVAYARVVAEAREAWDTGKHHTAGNIVRYLQSVWSLAECPDEALVPLLGFLTVQ